MANDNNKKLDPMDDSEDNILYLSNEDDEIGRYKIVDELEVDGVQYYAIISLDDKDDGYNVLKVIIDETGEETVTSVDDADEFNKIADMFDERQQYIDYDDIP